MIHQIEYIFDGTYLDLAATISRIKNNQWRKTDSISRQLFEIFDPIKTNIEENIRNDSSYTG